MAGDWIKIEHTLPTKPEVDQIANRLGIDHDAVVGKLVRLWTWADQQSVTGNDLRVTKSFLDRLTDCHGFADALVEVDWLRSRNDRFSLPNFDRHNGQTAKNRALTKDRVKRKRNDDSVTQSLPEKRREEKNTPTTNVVGVSTTPRTRKVFSKPTLAEVQAYCAERSRGVVPERWYAHYEANGWKVGKNPMADWKAAVRTWEETKNEAAPASRYVHPDSPEAEGWNPW